MNPAEHLQEAARGLKTAARRLAIALLPRTSDEAPESLGDRILRYRHPARKFDELAPNPAYLAQPESQGVVLPGKLVPRFRALPAGFHVAEIPIQPGTSLYGTGEVAGPFKRNGTTTTTWNHDAFGYNDATPHLYQSHPWVLGVRKDGSAFGVFCETTCKVTIRLDQGIRFETQLAPHTPDPAVVIIERDHPRDVVRALAELTGTMPLPPRWALGYQQCRWSYYPDARVREIAQGFRDRDIPCDVIWLDIDYMDDFRCFTFDNERFPDPKALNDHLHAQGFKAVYMIDPGIKVDPDYRVYQELRDNSFAVTDKDGNEYQGHVWPGACAFPDFTREEVREWWAGLYPDFMAAGIDGVWNDMNEPAIFHVDSKTMPEDNMHYADEELGGAGTHARYHNLYANTMTMATREGVQRANPDKRPFVLTRAGYLGSQRFAATWTGDNLANWEHLRWSIPMVLNLGLSGQPFSGPDIGGFGHISKPDLFARWMGIGALLPFARGHKNKWRDEQADGAGTAGEMAMPDHEPWSLGPDVERVCKLAIQRRYRLMPYLYTLFERASITGDPVAQPLFFADPTDPKLRDVDDSFLLGDDVLVRASAHRGEDEGCLAAMPAGVWRRFEPVSDTTNTHVDADTDAQLPTLHIRAGAIVPMGPIYMHDDERPEGPLTLVVALDGQGRAEGELYEDAGEGYGYRSGDYLRTTYRAQTDAAGNTTVRIDQAEGDRIRPERELRIECFGTDSRLRTAIGTDGHPITIDAV